MNLDRICFIKKGCNGEETDDVRSLSLQKFHKEIWNVRFNQFFNEGKISTKIDLQEGSAKEYLFHEDDEKNTVCYSSDTLCAGFSKYAMPDDFYWLAHTFGGKIIYPRHTQSLNKRRGFKVKKLHKRVDFTLKYIRDFYDLGWNNENILFTEEFRNEDEEKFFALFGSFKNYVEFFFLDDFVRENQETKKLEIIDLIHSEYLGKPEEKYVPIQGNDEPSFPECYADYGRWCDNSIGVIHKRNQKIFDFIYGPDNKNLKQSLIQIINDYYSDKDYSSKISNYVYLR